ncbi:MAG: Calx-beta domain-containing protein [Candidatus Cryptobacteroides sp.]
MKYILKFATLSVASVVAFASCNLNDYPVFDDNDAFVKMEKSSISVEENAKTVSIPVSLVAVNTVGVAVPYTIESDKAVEGVNYRLTEPSAVLTFDGTERYKDIVIEIIDKPGSVDGDISFTVTLGKPNNLNVGYQNTCTVTILDLDHPLAEILGEYAAHGVDAWYGTEYNWTMTLSKVAGDDKAVAIEGISYGQYCYIGVQYGVVNDDKDEISVPLGGSIEMGTYDGNPYYGKFGVYYYDTDVTSTEGTLVLTYDKATKTWTCIDNSSCFCVPYVWPGDGVEYWAAAIEGPVTYVKK